jgi:hypothetical protein
MLYRLTTLVAGLVVSGCGSVKSDSAGDASPSVDAAVDDGAMADAAIDGPPPPPCDLTKPFGTPMPVPGIHDPLGNDVHASLTADELTIYFASDREDHVNYHIYTATRAARNADFSGIGFAPGTFSMAGESHPSISSDGNTIFFDSFREPPTTGSVHVFRSTRANASVEFPTPMSLADNSLIAPAILGDGSALYVANLENGGLSRFDRMGAGFGSPQNVSLNHRFSVKSPVTRDDLLLFMSEGASVGNKILFTTRTAVTQAWPAPMPLAEIQPTAVLAEPSWISPDGCRLYLTLQATSTDRSRIFFATRPR